MELILALIIFVLVVVGIVDAVQGKLPTSKKVLWVILMLFIPPLGLILYYLLGKQGA